MEALCLEVFNGLAPFSHAMQNSPWEGPFVLGVAEILILDSSVYVYCNIIEKRLWVFQNKLR